MPKHTFVCDTCCRKCSKTVLREPFKPVQKTVFQDTPQQHFHYGYPVERFAICPVYHYTKVKTEEVKWNPCLLCDQKSPPSISFEDEELKEKYKDQKQRRQSHSMASSSPSSVTLFSGISAPSSPTPSPPPTPPPTDDQD